MRERSARPRGTPRPSSHGVRGWPRRTSRALSPPRPAASGCPDHGLWGSVRRRSARRSRERARGVGFSGQLCLNGGSPEGATGQFFPLLVRFFQQRSARVNSGRRRLGTMRRGTTTRRTDDHEHTDRGQGVRGRRRPTSTETASRLLCARATLGVHNPADATRRSGIPVRRAPCL